MYDSLISRQAVLDDFNSIMPTNYEKGSYKHGIAVGITLCTVAAKAQASVEPGIDEWCTDCREYDQEKHSCPRFNRVIRETVEEAKQKTGKWVYGEHDVAMCDGYFCKNCGFFVPWNYKLHFIDFIKDYHYCPHCGTRMETENACDGDSCPIEYK